MLLVEDGTAAAALLVGVVVCDGKLLLVGLLICCDGLRLGKHEEAVGAAVVVVIVIVGATCLWRLACR